MVSWVSHLLALQVTEGASYRITYSLRITIGFGVVHAFVVLKYCIYPEVACYYQVTFPSSRGTSFNVYTAGVMKMNFTFI